MNAETEAKLRKDIADALRKHGLYMHVSDIYANPVRGSVQIAILATDRVTFEGTPHTGLKRAVAW